MAFTGELIGEELSLRITKVNLKALPVLLTSGDPDPHIPLSRIEEIM